MIVSKIYFQMLFPGRGRFPGFRKVFLKKMMIYCWDAAGIKVGCHMQTQYYP
jgi:hypothetical protein